MAPDLVPALLVTDSASEAAYALLCFLLYMFTKILSRPTDCLLLEAAADDSVDETRAEESTEADDKADEEETEFNFDSVLGGFNDSASKPFLPDSFSLAFSSSKVASNVPLPTLSESAVTVLSVLLELSQEPIFERAPRLWARSFKLSLLRPTIVQLSVFKLEELAVLFSMTAPPSFVLTVFGLAPPTTMPATSAMQFTAEGAEENCFPSSLINSPSDIKAELAVALPTVATIAGLPAVCAGIDGKFSANLCCIPTLLPSSSLNSFLNPRPRPPDAKGAALDATTDDAAVEVVKDGIVDDVFDVAADCKAGPVVVEDDNDDDNDSNDDVNRD